MSFEREQGERCALVAVGRAVGVCPLVVGPGPGRWRRGRVGKGDLGEQGVRVGA
ncbi:hypothetical protein [Nocardiopsis xinjiangensis]|uniref:hypothetical protein n=1 Tax=Nocardiopsis xinjiangensis TaxID=124285 RepID=UPI00034879CD|nr:hypothetical protein [Nocardiopsis xinjiangensis]